MKKLILIVRDCGYLQWQRAKHNHEESLQKGNEFAVAILTISWSMPVLSLLAITSNRLGYGPYAHYLRVLINQNPLLKIVFGVFMFAPFYLLARWQINTLNDTPVNPTLPYRWLMIISWGMLIVSFSMMIIVPLMIQALFPR